MAEIIKAKKRFYGWTNAILLFGVYLGGMGFVFYGFAVVFPAMIKTLDWNRGTASIAHTITVLLMGMSIPLVAVSINKIGAKKNIVMGLSMLFVSLVLMGTVMTQMWQWILLWGIVSGFAFAFCGMLPIQTTVMHWFNVKRATVVGFTTTGAAVGGFLAQPFYTWFMGAVDSWRVGWLSGALFVFIALVGSFFLENKPGDLGQHPDGLDPEEIEAAKKQSGTGPRTYRTAKTWETKAAFQNPIVYLITIAIIGHLVALILITTHGVLHFMDKGFTKMQAASVLSLIILASGAARFPSGWIGDRIEPRYILIVTFVLQLIAYLGIWKSVNPTIVMVTGAVFGASYGCQLVIFPTLIGNYYGPEAFTNINGVIGPFLVLAVAMVPVGAGYIFETYSSYDPAFIIMIVMLTVSLVFSFLLTPPKNKKVIPGG